MTIKFVPLLQRDTYHRIDTAPFIIVHILTLFLMMMADEEDVWSSLYFLVGVFLHSFLFLCGHWSTRMRVRIQYKPLGKECNLQNLQQATHLYVEYQKKHANKKLEIINLLFSADKDEFSAYFFYKKYIFDKVGSKFVRTKQVLSLGTISEIQSRINTTDFSAIPVQQFDPNQIEIKLKKFSEVFFDQIMEPFSFFQMFSVSLWLMDDNRMQPLMTLGLLLMISFTVVIQKMKTMLMLRQMKLNPQLITVYRNEKFIKISSQELVPGDICILQNSDSIKPVIQKDQISDEEYLLREIPFSEKLPQKLFKTENMNSDSFKQLPCDFLVISGGCVVNEAILTGESVPQIKESIDKCHLDERVEPLTTHKNHFLFCGTEVIQTYPSNECAWIQNKNIQAQSQTNCIVMVVKTGFDTNKGKLVRGVMFNNENLAIKQKDAFILIFILLIFSIISSAYVLFHGLQEEERSKKKLLLRCIIIITTVVPPELPMILTIAVNSSLLYLQKKRIYCTETFRIPYGGKVNICAFDKTGTLTSDNFQLKGLVDECKGEKTEMKNKKLVSLECQSVLAGCHSLIQIDKKLQGDQIELLFFNTAPEDWTYNSMEKTARSKVQQRSVKILEVFPFKSDLKRMCSIVQYIQESELSYRALVKGAPEVIKDLLVDVPENYDATFEFYTKQGYRVISLAYQLIKAPDNQKYVREQFECGLTWCGFLVCESPLKRDTKQHIQILQKAQLDVKMITGDNLLTGLSVGRQLQLGTSRTLNDYSVIEAQNVEGIVVLSAHDSKNKKSLSLTEQQIHSLSLTNILCLEGKDFEILKKGFKAEQIGHLLKHIHVFARTSPKQKEEIITFLKKTNNSVLMCGDGTNDVGALKKSDLGVALVGMKEQTEEEYLREKEKKRKFKEEIKKDPRKLLQHHQQEAQSTDLFGGEQVNYRFGDACIAAPFTSKNSNSIRCVTILLRQGICTLVKTINTYKILALSSLIQAYCLSALHFQALKFSDTQYLLIGIGASASYYCFSNSKPLKTISHHRPTSTIVEPYFAISIIYQVALHIYGIEQSLQIGLAYDPHYDKEAHRSEVNHDEQFKPTFISTSVFLFQLLSQTLIFLLNNGGEPHMEGVKQSPRYLYFMFGLIAMTFMMTLQISPDDFSEYFEITFEDVNVEAQYKLVYLFAKVCIINYFGELTIRYLKFKELFNWI